MTRELVHLNSQLSHTSLTPAGRVELLDYILQTERAHATAKATHEELARQRAAKNDQLRQSWQLQQTRKTVDMEDAVGTLLPGESATGGGIVSSSAANVVAPAAIGGPPGASVPSSAANVVAPAGVIEPPCERPAAETRSDVGLPSSSRVGLPTPADDTMEGTLSSVTPEAGCAVRGPTAEVAVVADKSLLTRLEIMEEAIRLQCVHTSRLANVIEAVLPHTSAAGPIEDDGGHLSPLLPACQTARARQRTVKRGRDAAAADADCVPATVAWAPASPTPKVTVALAPTAPASTAVCHFDAEASSVGALQGSLGAVDKSEPLSPPAPPVGKPTPPPAFESPPARRTSIPDALLRLVGFLDSSTDDSDGGDARTSVQRRAEKPPLPENPNLCLLPLKSRQCAVSPPRTPPPVPVKCVVGGVDITSSFLRIFSDPSLYRWLDDDAINAFGVCVERRLPPGPASRSVVWLSTYVWPSIVGLARRTPRPTTLGDNVAATMASRVDPYNWGRFALPLHHPGSDTKADHWTLCAVDGEATPPTVSMADSLRPSAASPIDLAAHAVEERRLAGLVLWWMSLLASAVGASFVAGEWMIKTSPPTLQQQVQPDCGIFMAYWGAYHLKGGDVHNAPALDTLAYRVFMKRALAFHGNGGSSSHRPVVLCVDRRQPPAPESCC